jgi:hypothetical protein
MIERTGTEYGLLREYWVSGAVGHRLQARVRLPLVATFPPSTA